MDRQSTPYAGLKQFRADLHVHSALSPCASEQMTPPLIVARAMELGLDMIAISDHNSAGNARAVQEAADEAGGTLTVLAGMEITSAEEVHVVGLFPSAEAAEEVSAKLRAMLATADEQYYSFFGDQPLLAADGGDAGSETATLAWATPLDLSETVQLVHSAGGLAIAAHVDRKSFSVLSQLGFFPPEAEFDGVELSKFAARRPEILEQVAGLGLPVTRSSDGHYLEDIGAAYTELLLAEPTFSELALALAERDGRSVARA
jgi:predicted metal-dependent phosphoesterase TrpH